MKFSSTLSHVFRHIILSLKRTFIFLNKARPRVSKIITEERGLHIGREA